MPGPAFLEGERLTLRTVESEDRAFVHQHWNDPTIRRLTARQRPQTARDVEAFIEKGDAIHFLPCRDRTPVGFLWLFKIDRTALRGNIGYWIVPGERGNGYATEAAHLAVRYAFDELGLNKVVAHVFEDNTASARVLEKLGFEREGILRDHYWVNGEYVDAYFYGRLATEQNDRET